MNTNKNKEVRLIISAGVFIFAAVFFAGVLVNQQNNEKGEQFAHEHVITEDREDKQELETWMSDLFEWVQAAPKALQAIEPSVEVTEAHFELINGRMENVFASESDDDIALESWMLNKHQLKKMQGI